MHSWHLHVTVHSSLITSRDVLGPSRLTEKILRYLGRSAHLMRIRQSSALDGSGAYYPGLGVLSGCGCYSRSRVAETSTRRAQGEEDEVRQQSATAALRS